VYDVQVEGESKPIGATGSHPFWCADRNAWVPVRELRIGERVQVEGRTAKVLRIEECGDEPVFNLEVDVDHCYRVGEQGILVHNQSTPCTGITGIGWVPARKENYATLYARDPSNPGRPNPYVIEITRAITARLNSSSIRTGAYTPPAGFITDNFIQLRRFYAPPGATTSTVLGDARIGYNFRPTGDADTAGHILPDQFGGPHNTHVNFFPQSKASQAAYDDVWGGPHPSQQRQSNGQPTIYNLVAGATGCEVCVRIVLTYHDVPQFPFVETGNRPYRPYLIHVYLWNNTTHARLPGRRFTNPHP
jgi:hypothetical protein